MVRAEELVAEREPGIFPHRRTGTGLKTTARYDVRMSPWRFVEILREDAAQTADAAGRDVPCYPLFPVIHQRFLMSVSKSSATCTFGRESAAIDQIRQVLRLRGRAILPRTFTALVIRASRTGRFAFVRGGRSAGRRPLGRSLPASSDSSGHRSSSAVGLKPAHRRRRPQRQGRGVSWSTARTGLHLETSGTWIRRASSRSFFSSFAAAASSGATNVSGMFEARTARGAGTSAPRFRSLPTHTIRAIRFRASGCS